MKLYGVWEAAEALGLSRPAFMNRRNRDGLCPKPIAELKMGPIWDDVQITFYKGILDGEKEAKRQRVRGQEGSR